MHAWTAQEMQTKFRGLEYSPYFFRIHNFVCHKMFPDIFSALVRPIELKFAHKVETMPK